MPVTAVVGAQWGDEGKGKITDLLAQEADLVMRYGGGSNAGHTVINRHGEFKLHLVPSGIFNPRAVSLIGTGTVVDFDFLSRELDALGASGIDTSRLRISGRAHVVMPYHLLLDRLDEEARGRRAIGTTRRGVGPAYVDKAGRAGIQVDDLMHAPTLEAKLRAALPEKNRLLTETYGHLPLEEQDLLDLAARWRERFASAVVDQLPLVSEMLQRDARVLLEGQLGALRDLDWGTYPFVTSSATVAGGGGVGGGIPPMRIASVMGVVKAYTSAVGAGPLPTELQGSAAEDLRERGGEYGATTGRPRRVGWFDAVAARYSCLLSGFTSIAVTKLDVLDGIHPIPVCTAYRGAGRRLSSLPPTHLLEQVEPEYEEMPGWQAPTSAARSWEDLPREARSYLSRLQELVGAPVRIVSVGPGRDETIIQSERGVAALA